MRIAIDGGKVLRPEGLTEETLVLEDGRVGPGTAAPRRYDARGLLVLPGIVDIHGDAFERQIMPRPGVHFPLDTALADTDRQMLANGITTAYHGITCSWEPGLRSRDNFVHLSRRIHQLRDTLACDTRVHLRFENFNLDCVDDALGWLAEGLVSMLAFNDHLAEIRASSQDPRKSRAYCDRTGLSHDQFRDLVERVHARAGEVPAAIEALAAAARAQGIPMLSHDDPTPQTRAYYHDLGCRVAEFPKNEATARHALALGNPVVLGAPNVLRGGSHNGSVNAQPMVAAGLCQVLASDYYYPAPLQAAFRLVQEGVVELAQAWRLIAANPARAAGLSDRGELAEGQRADLILVDASRPACPQVAAVFVAGRPVYLAAPSLAA